MRPATRLITPWCFSSTPRTRSAGAPRATVRNRFHTPFEQITLTRPVSSSRFRNTVPFAVDGLLAVRHDARDLDHRAVGELAQVGRGHHALARELLAHELGGVLADA